MSLETVLFSEVGVNGTSPAVDLGPGELTEDVGLQVEVTGTVSAFSVQLLGSIDGELYVNIGSAVTTASVTHPAVPAPMRYLKATLSGYTGTGTLDVTLSVVPEG